MSLKLSVLGLLLSVLRISTLCRLIALTFTSWMRLGILHVIVLWLYTKQLYGLQYNNTCSRNPAAAGQTVSSAVAVMCSILSLVLSSKYKATIIRNKYTPVSKVMENKGDAPLWDFHPLQALCFAAFPFPSPATFLWWAGCSCCFRATGGSSDFSPGQSRTQATLATEPVVYHNCKVFGFCPTGYSGRAVDRLLLTWRAIGGLTGGRGRCRGRGRRGWHDWRRRRWWWWGRGLIFTSPLRSPEWRSRISVSIPGDRSRRDEPWRANHVADNYKHLLYTTCRITVYLTYHWSSWSECLDQPRCRPAPCRRYCRLCWRWPSRQLHFFIPGRS